MYDIENFNDSGQVMHVCAFDQINQMGALVPLGDSTSGRWAFGSFDEVKTGADSCEAMRAGRGPEAVLAQYTKLRDELEPTVQDLVVRLPSVKRQRKYGIEGSEIDMARAMVHDPECWERRVRGAAKLTVRIAISFCYSGGHDVSLFAQSAARGVALADALTALGYGVEVAAVSASTKGNAHYYTTGLLKASDRPMDPQQMLLSAYPAMLRWHQFAQWEAYADNDDAAMGQHSHWLSSIEQAHVDAFGIDVYLQPEGFKFLGSDESPVADSVQQIAGALWGGRR